jgi:hypothetical protein
MSSIRSMTAFGLVATIAIGAIGELQAAPVPVSAAAPKAAAALSAVVDVRWGRWGGRGWGWRRPGIVIGAIGFGAVGIPYYGSPYYGGPYWAGYPGYWGSRSSTCWDRGRRVLCPGSGP